MLSTTIRRLFALGAIMLLAAACAGSGDGEDAGGAGAASDTGAARGMQGGGYYGGGGGMDAAGTTGETGAAGGAGAGAELSVALNNYLFDPARIEVASGATIELQNANANTPHTFTVRGTDVDVSLEPLTSDTAVIDLDPGSYTVICRLHYDSFDMEAELTVT
jgi:plastocyanin